MTKPIGIASGTYSISAHFKVGDEPAAISMDKASQNLTLAGPIGAGAWSADFLKDLKAEGFEPRGTTTRWPTITKQTFDATQPRQAAYERIVSTLPSTPEPQTRFAHVLEVFEKHGLAPKGACEHAKGVLAETVEAVERGSRSGGDGDRRGGWRF